MDFFYYSSLLFFLQFYTLSEGRPNSDIDIGTCKCQSFQTCQWSNESFERINSKTQFPGETQLFKDNVCNTETQFVWCCRNSEGKEVVPAADQLRILKIHNSGLWKPNGFKGECGTRNTLTNIVCNGNCDASIGEFPWMALLGYDYESQGYGTIYTCGGSLINKWYVLTAAHCVVNTEAELSEIVLGEHKIGTDPDCQTGESGNLNCQPKKIVRQPAEVFVHENYDNVTEFHDIALIRLNEAVPLFQENPSESYANPICLSWLENDPLRELKEGKYAIVSGWGRTTKEKKGGTVQSLIELSAGSEVLQRVRVPIANKEKCERFNSSPEDQFDHRIQVCAGGQRGRSSCNGDSGGPLIARELAGDPWYQIGLVSFGTKTCGTHLPSVYTKVAAHIPWIESKLKP